MTREQGRILRYLLRFRRGGGWETFSRRDLRAQRALRTLESHGVVEVTRYGRGIDPQARLAIPEASE